MSEQTPVSRGRRRAAAALAYTGGAATALGALAAGVLVGQVLVARRTIPGAEAPPPRSSGRYGAAYAGAPTLRLALIGDSTAAGYGVHSRAETPGALLAGWLADASHRPVLLTCPAVVGSLSAWLGPQVEMALDAGVDLAIILIGANDVTTRAGDSAAVAHLAQAVRTMREAGAEVVVATCPDLGTIRPIRRPLRWLARHWSRQLAAAQTVAAVRAGARTVSLADLLGPRFDADPDLMFGLDRFHPSVAGYRAAAGVILPAALAALGLADELTPAADPPSLSAAAAAAADHPGREVSEALVADVDHPGSRRYRPRWLRARWIRTALSVPERGTAAAKAHLEAVPSVGTASVVAPAVAE